jgi:hypothetical protein
MVRIYGLFKREEKGRKGKILSSFIERHSKCPHRRWGLELMDSTYLLRGRSYLNFYPPASLGAFHMSPFGALDHFVDDRSG